MKEAVSVAFMSLVLLLSVCLLVGPLVVALEAILLSLATG